MQLFYTLLLPFLSWYIRHVPTSSCCMSVMYPPRAAHPSMSSPHLHHVLSPPTPCPLPTSTMSSPPNSTMSSLHLHHNPLTSPSRGRCNPPSGETAITVTWTPSRKRASGRTSTNAGGYLTSSWSRRSSLLPVCVLVRIPTKVISNYKRCF